MDTHAVGTTTRGPADSSLLQLLGFFVLHVVVWIGLMRPLAGADFVDYADIGAAATPWVRQFVIGLLVVLVLQVAFISRKGWWGPLLSEQTRLRAWWAFPPILLVAAAAVLRFATQGLSDAPTTWWVGFTATMALVGLTEELSFRGILLVGGRQLLDTEVKAWLFSSALFGLFHLPNALIGQALVPSLVQVVQTAIIGSSIYLVRRTSGSLAVAVVFHAVYDWMLIQGAFS